MVDFELFRCSVQVRAVVAGLIGAASVVVVGKWLADESRRPRGARVGHPALTSVKVASGACGDNRRANCGRCIK